MTQIDVAVISKICEALAEPHRVRIIGLLSGGNEMSNSAIAKELRISPSLLTHHLSALRAAGMIHQRKDGNWRWNSLNNAEEVAQHLRSVALHFSPIQPLAFREHR